MKFVKMHGAGNDYVYIDCFRQTVEDPESLAREISDRNFGVGGDGMILIEPSRQADVKMRIFNADGSEAEMCGNGVRCVAKYAFDHGLVDRTDITIETGAGNLPLTMYPNEREHIDKVRVNMGRPRLTREDLPMVGPANEQVINMDLKVLDKTFQVTCVSMGNPHCVIYVDNLDDRPRKSSAENIFRVKHLKGFFNARSLRSLKTQKRYRKRWLKVLEPILRLCPQLCVFALNS
ncbi:MAG: diaminopimelate epimerase [Desulfuromonadales bacterium]